MTDHVPDAVSEAYSRADAVDPVLGAYLRRFDDEAAAAAKELDAADGRGPLHGVLVGVKDNIAVRESPATGQSAVHDPQWWAGRDAPAVGRLRNAGAVVLGRTTMAEHALARPDPAAPYPVPRNPWDLERWPGGSSCGSAAGVAAGLFTAALGTDTNGSLRIPAALCGVTAIKPTHGLVPAAGVRPLARSLDTVGPIARDVRACAEVLAVLAGADAPEWRTDLSGVRVGVPLDALALADLSEDCAAAFQQAVDDLAAAGASVERIDLPEAFPLIAAQFVTLLAEAYEAYREPLRERWAEFGRPFRWNVIAGGLIDAATYLRAQRARAWAAGSLADRFAGLDAIALPTWPRTAPRYDDAARLQEVSGLPGMWNAAGLPAVALPMGRGADGLPLSLQLVGAPRADFRLAAVADVYQRRTGWHRPGPTVAADARPGPVTLSDERPAPADEAFADAVRALGVPVADEELPMLIGGHTTVTQLATLLPDLPTDIAPARF